MSESERRMIEILRILNKQEKHFYLLLIVTWSLGSPHNIEHEVNEQSSCCCQKERKYHNTTYVQILRNNSQ